MMLPLRGVGDITTATVYTSSDQPLALSDVTSYQQNGYQVNVVDRASGKTLVSIGPTQDALSALNSAGLPFVDVYQGADYEFSKLFNAAVVGQGASSYDTDAVRAMVLNQMKQQGWTDAQLATLTGPALVASGGVVTGAQMVTQPSQVPANVPTQLPADSPCHTDYSTDPYGKLICPVNPPSLVQAQPQPTPAQPVTIAPPAVAMPTPPALQPAAASLNQPPITPSTLSPAQNPLNTSTKPLMQSGPAIVPSTTSQQTASAGSEIPTWAWVAGGAALLFLFAGGKR